MFRRILVPIDLEEPSFSDQALALAVKGVRDSGAQLHLMSVIPGASTPLVTSYFHQSALKKATRSARIALEQVLQRLVPDSIAVSMHVLYGDPCEQILKQARDLDADLLIMAAHNRDRPGIETMGSISVRVADKARCSVVVLRRSEGQEQFEFQAADVALNVSIN